MVHINNTEMMRQIILCLMALLMICSCSSQEIKEGDIIFQTSQSKQSPLIALATKSDKTHCGIIVEKNNELYVLETLGTIKLTPLKIFIDRGAFGRYWVKHIHGNHKVRYKKYLGIPYDLAFKMNNSRYYCSELVYTIYKEQFGIELCKPRQIKDYNILGMAKVLKRRGMNIEQKVVAPSDLYESDYFKR